MIKSEFVLKAKFAERKTPALLAIPLLFAFVMISGVINMMLFAPTIARHEAAAKASAETGFDPFAMFDALVMYGGFYGSLLACIFLWVSYFERREFWTIGLELGFVRKTLRGICLGLGTATVVAVLLVVFTPAQISFEVFKIPGPALLAAVLFLPVLWCLVAFAEEVAFRGFLLQTIGARNGLVVGAIITSIVFSGFHFEDRSISVLFYFGMFAISFFLCWYAIVENSLWGPIGFRAAYEMGGSTIFQITPADAVSGPHATYHALANSPHFFSILAKPEHLHVTVFGVMCGLIIFLAARGIFRQS